MAKTLVIAEKPSVARDLVAALPGNFVRQDNYYEAENFVVTSAIGHLVRLANPEEYDPNLKKWDLEALPILPDRFILKAEDRTREQLLLLHQLLKRDDIEQVINACDAGREGELIFAYIYDISQAQKPVSRLWISSMTREAIKEGFEKLRTSDQMRSLEAAARSRSEADWLVGINATRAATVRSRGIFDGVVSLGRVQTPTLAMIIKRELEIEAFCSTDYFVIEAAFDSGSGASDYCGFWFKGEDKYLQSIEAAQVIVDKIVGKTGKIIELTKKETQERPPLLYDLTTLQREANSKFGFSAEHTLKTAQSLYESRKAITYPRTNSRFLTSDMGPKLKQTAKTLVGIPEFTQAVEVVLNLNDIPSRIIDDSKVEDHYAIIPTLQTHNPESFDEDERKVFDLIARRFLAVFHPPARYDATRVITEVEGEHFRTTNRVVLDLGWRILYGQDVLAEDKKEEDEIRFDALPELNQDQAVECLEAQANKKETKPPRHFSESSLLAAMETAGRQVEDDELREAMKESGLGTPATRAAIIERLLSVGYITRKGRQLLATEKGTQVIQILGDHPLVSPELTGSWEKRLRDVEQGQLERSDFMDEICSFTKDTVYLITTLSNDLIGGPLRDNVGICPRCGEIIKESAKAFSCSSWKSKEEPGCGFVIWKEVAKKRLTPEIAIELLTQGRTSIPIEGFHSSKDDHLFSAYLVLGAEDKVSFEFPPPEEVAPDAQDAIGICPLCGKGVIEKPKSFSCSSWKSKEKPGCGFVIWKDKAHHEVSLEEAKMLLREGKTAVFDDFLSRSEKPFSAALVLREGEVDFDFPALVEVAPDAEGALGACPRCGKGVITTASAYSCSSYKSKTDKGCGFVIWKNMSNRAITLDEAKELLAHGETSPLQGFKSKEGIKFFAALKINDENEVVLIYQNAVVDASSEASLGACPLCGKGVIEKPKSFSCSSWKSKEEPGCGFVIWKEVAKKKIGVKIAKNLLKDGRTEELSGFKSQAGKTFSASLVINEGRVEFEFEKRELSEEVLGLCPLCNREVKETPKAYSCRKTKSDDNSCKFVVWKEMSGRAITLDEVKEILKDGITSLPLKGFRSKSSGKTFEAYLFVENGKISFKYNDDSPKTSAGGIALDQ